MKLIGDYLSLPIANIMISAAEILFWISLIILIYTYLGYPIILIIATVLKKIFVRQPIQLPSQLPAVTLIITAYNEEDIIESKIENIQKLKYPTEKLQVIVVADGSTDNTTELVRNFPFILLLHDPVRRGKLAAMNRAVEFATHDILIFNDANGFLNPESISRIVMHYSNDEVGAVSGEKRIINAQGVVGEGEGLYWKYESILKKLDSDLKTIVGAAGELFSIRRHLYNRLPENVIIEDFVQSLLLCHKGYVVKYEPGAWSAETPSMNILDEMERKIRISAGAFQAMQMLLPLLNFVKHPLLTFMYISHRVLRWTICPLALVVMFVSNVFLVLSSGSLWYQLMLPAQFIFYVMTLIGWAGAVKGKKYPLFYFPFYFVFMNWCVFIGFYRYVMGSQQSIWKKAART